MTTSELHSRGKAVFLAVRELGPAERSSYLDEACAGDSGLRREVESLLAHHVQSPEGAAADETGARTVDSDSVPGFRLIRRLGEGGMGEVFEAQQLRPVRRRTAIKLLKRGLETREVVTRFESERQALALMDHPHVARVFEAGSTADGRPYFAMEFVDGVAITLHCDRRRLSVRERLELFAQVCRGVQHAHQRGVIHRDLKSSNVLVSLEDGRAVPKVIDFGIAKAAGARLTDKTLVTRAGDWMGTPETMSPEQAAGNLDIDTRSDVYSLGVMLYELLTGSLPFDPRDAAATSAEEMRRRIRFEQPVRPSVRIGRLGDAAPEVARDRGSSPEELAGALSGDLEWITLKALEKDRARRYESPAALADDIARHLADEPVQARPPSVVYRLRKFVKRHRLGVAACLVMGSSLAVGAGGLLRGLLVARGEAESAERAARALVGVLEELNPLNAEGFARSPAEVVARARQRIDAELAEQPILRARLLATLGRIHTVVGDYREAAPLLADAVATQRDHLGPEHQDLAASLSALGSLQLATGQYERAQESFQESLAIRRAAAPGSLETARAVADFGVVLMRRAQFERAEELFAEALGLKAAALGLDHPEVYDVRYFQSQVQAHLGALEEARRGLTEVLANRRRVLPEDHPAIGWCLNSLGFLEQRAGDWRASVTHLRESVRTLEAAFGPDHPAVALPLGNLAWTLYLAGNRAEARASAERALEIRRLRLGPDHPSISWSLATLGALERLEGRYEAALELHRRQLEVAEAAVGADHPDAGWARFGIGLTLLRLRRFDEARSHLERARALFDALPAGGGTGSGWTRSALGYLARQEGELDRALYWVEDAVSLLERELGASHPQLAEALMNLGALRRDRGELEPARQLIERGYALRLRALGPDHPGHADDLHTLARLNHHEGNVEAAARLYRQAIEATVRVLGPEHPWVARALADLEALERGELP